MLPYQPRPAQTKDLSPATDSLQISRIKSTLVTFFFFLFLFLYFSKSQAKKNRDSKREFAVLRSVDTRRVDFMTTLFWQLKGAGTQRRFRTYGDIGSDGINDKNKANRNQKTRTSCVDATEHIGGQYNRDRGARKF